ncbi:unnamed protein product [Didymodactylos carnosus]|uniref:Uncharacterized protein n=1 Tax=Didymodactylos carnosus TaxID=1234261 RepID=A0A814E993_9BILA|nr:unnamed protein product [Didymodactylos carnosus]CAF0966396.1 unnamed protein product [Didymodactylos carnosus]CAF3602055.1 unnamed protein product [Didymodactylos carnosus]CAF3739912.1 unnamed protein product [Didymodactylos carnosus]
MTLVLSIIFVLLTRSLDGSLFDPDTSNYDAYGLKVAANDNLIVEALNDYQQFYIQFAPYSSNVVQSTNLFCAIDFNASSQYIYAVAIGKNQSSSQLYFFFVGELTNIEEDEYLNRTFVGMLSYTDNITLSNATVVDCDQFQYDVNYITSPHPHQEYLTLAVDPLGLAAYGFSNNFSFSYDVESQNLSWWPGSSFWPNSTFMPHAVDCREEYGVVAGFVDNGQNSRIKFSPFVYLFDMTVSTAPTVLSSWTYTVTGTWQAGQTNAGADQYAAKYDMSVAINTIGQVLVGIQSMNSVFLFSTNGTTMTLVTWRDNGRSLGFGKGVAWLGFTDIQIIGGLRIGLSGTGEEEEDMILKDLEFYQPFNLSDNILAQNVEVTMQITKVVNETIALIGDESKLSDEKKSEKETSPYDRLEQSVDEFEAFPVPTV